MNGKIVCTVTLRLFVRFEKFKKRHKGRYEGMVHNKNQYDSTVNEKDMTGFVSKAAQKYNFLVLAL